MRVKRKKHGKERLEACSELLIDDIKSEKCDPKSFFSNGNPVRIEIGCGKGDFEPVFRRNRAGDPYTDGVFCCISEKAASCKSVHRTEARSAGSDKIIV